MILELIEVSYYILHKQGHVTITWDNPDELEEYISRLRSAADRLTSENRRLRKCHGTLVDKVFIVHKNFEFVILCLCVHYEYSTMIFNFRVVA